MNFIKLCNEVGIWSEMNFGQQPADNPLLGVLEEIGEISHSFLKSLQGIRGSEAEHIDAMKDGIGDAMVFLADFCYRANLVKSFNERADYLIKPFGECIVTGKAIIRPRDADARYYLFQTATDVGRTYNRFILHEAVFAIHIEAIIHDLTMFCWMQHFSFAECVMTTWAMVKQRDWTKNKLTGGA